MKCARSDTKRDKRATKCPNSSWLGYSSNRLHVGDMFTYKEHYEDDGCGRRSALCHGRVSPLGGNGLVTGYEVGRLPLNGDKWYILAQSISDDMQFTYERWIDPEDVQAIVPADRVHPDVRAFLLDRELNYHDV